MKRRGAIQHLALAAGTFFLTPAWANRWTKASIPAMTSFLSGVEEELLAEVVETIIPATDTPGAKELGIPAFVQRMVLDCYEKPVQDNVKAGLTTVSSLTNERYGKRFEAADTSQRLAVLSSMLSSTDASQKEFMALMKSLTVQGYTTSEYVMTKFYHYVMAPGHYYGCVPLKTAGNR